MPVYVIVDVQVKDAALYEQYKPGVPALVKKHGGEFLARGGRTEIIEGARQPGRVVLFRFPDATSVHAFFNDPEYLPLKAIRHRASEGSIVMVEGLE
ncbi:MAG TPA: DUF1330 domain-containing protein [Polyangiaceae bacterium]|jgi:uncharacterized protein (DUF1330 family)|nr:DUF1330 domain-containing protein [Polyangiaceae bacterium]